MEPEYRLGQYLKYVGCGVEADNVTELMDQYRSMVLRLIQTGKISRQVNAAAKQTPYERLGDVTCQPYFW